MYTTVGRYYCKHSYGK